jgi:dsRNA-specific ribonuclease
MRAAAPDAAASSLRPGGPHAGDGDAMRSPRSGAAAGGHGAPAPLPPPPSVRVPLADWAARQLGLPGSRALERLWQRLPEAAPLHARLDALLSGRTVRAHHRRPPPLRPQQRSACCRAPAASSRNASLPRLQVVCDTGPGRLAKTLRVDFVDPRTPLEAPGSPPRRGGGGGAGAGARAARSQRRRSLAGPDQEPRAPAAGGGATLPCIGALREPAAAEEGGCGATTCAEPLPLGEGDYDLFPLAACFIEVAEGDASEAPADLPRPPRRGPGWAAPGGLPPWLSPRPAAGVGERAGSGHGDADGSGRSDDGGGSGRSDDGGGSGRNDDGGGSGRSNDGGGSGRSDDGGGSGRSDTGGSTASFASAREDSSPPGSGDDDAAAAPDADAPASLAPDAAPRAASPPRGAGQPAASAPAAPGPSAPRDAAPAAAAPSSQGGAAAANYKGALKELAERAHIAQPQYRSEHQGGCHAALFATRVQVSGALRAVAGWRSGGGGGGGGGDAPLVAEGTGPSKRAAEQDAARALLSVLGVDPAVPAAPAAPVASAAPAAPSAAGALPAAPQVPGPGRVLPADAAAAALADAARAPNPKGRLQELAGRGLLQALGVPRGALPEYASEPPAGPPHPPRFRERVRLRAGGGGDAPDAGGGAPGGALEAVGEAASRKAAQAAAAAEMLALLLRWARLLQGRGGQ